MIGKVIEFQVSGNSGAHIIYALTEDGKLWVKNLTFEEGVWTEIET